VDTGLVQVNLSELYRFQNNIPQAALYAEPGLRVLEANLSLNHPLVLEARANLAFIEQAQAHESQAIRLYEQVLNQVIRADAQTNSFSSQSSETQSSWQSLYAKAILTAPRFEHLVQPTLFAPRQDMAQVMLNLARLYLDLKKPNQALPWAEQALARDEERFGAEYPRVAMDLDACAQAHVQLKQISSAGPLLERALAIQKKQLPANHPNRQGVLSHYAEFLRLSNREADAQAVEKEIAATHSRKK
jgi:tetratricopeptide (TPR) repeat protein